MSGAQTGMMETTMPPRLTKIHKDRHRGPRACCVVVRGTAVQMMCVLPTATGMVPGPGTSTSVFVV
jgi:hypothetical protein